MARVPWLLLMLGGLVRGADEPPRGAALLKTDLMGVFAHPDDEVGMAATVARYALGEGKVVAHVYATRGEGGGNMVGTHWGPALGVLREAHGSDPNSQGKPETIKHRLPADRQPRAPRGQG